MLLIKQINCHREQNIDIANADIPLSLALLKNINYSPYFVLKTWTHFAECNFLLQPSVRLCMQFMNARHGLHDACKCVKFHTEEMKNFVSAYALYLSNYQMSTWKPCSNKYSPKNCMLEEMWHSFVFIYTAQSTRVLVCIFVVSIFMRWCFTGFAYHFGQVILA